MPVWARGERLWNCSGADGASSRSMSPRSRSRVGAESATCGCSRSKRLTITRPLRRSSCSVTTSALARRSKALRLLRRLRPLADRIVAGANDPYTTEDPAHLAYQERNRKRGRMPGQLRLRVRYRDLIGPWFDYLIVSPDEMATIVEGAQWRFARCSKRAAAATTWPF